MISQALQPKAVAQKMVTVLLMFQIHLWCPLLQEVSPDP